MANWTDITLFDPDDLAIIEPVLTDGLTVSDDLEAEIKDHFEAELRRRFAALQATCEAYNSAYDILDHIDNPDKLERGARYYCLYLLFYGQEAGTEGIYNDKAKEYQNKYEIAFTDACGMLEFDSTTEDYTGTDYGDLRLVV